MGMIGIINPKFTQYISTWIVSETISGNPLPLIASLSIIVLIVIIVVIIACDDENHYDDDCINDMHEN